MKRVKMVIYGEPGVGKSTFASKAPKPFFITTDGNYEWLDLPDQDHIQVNSWEDAKKAFNMDFSNYETIVIDLTEDLFKWCESEFCIKNRIDHISDIGYGKGYDITRNNFFIEICKLINLDKNIIFIMHGLTTTVKDRRGVEHTKYIPTNRIPDKVLDMIEGRVRYFLRCYLKAEETPEDNVLIKKRYLSLIPKENEFGICRGIDENIVPHDIPLDFNEFAKIIGLNNNSIDIKEKQEEAKTKTKKEIKKESSLEAQKSLLETSSIESNIINKEENKPTIEVKIEEKQEKTNDEKLDAIRAKLAALKNE